jgi:hypothetical protein
MACPFFKQKRAVTERHKDITEKSPHLGGWRVKLLKINSDYYIKTDHKM